MVLVTRPCCCIIWRKMSYLAYLIDIHQHGFLTDRMAVKSRKEHRQGSEPLAYVSLWSTIVRIRIPSPTHKNISLEAEALTRF